MRKSGRLTSRENTRGSGGFQQSARRQPRRDRDPRLPDAARARHRDRCRLLGGRPRRGPRRLRGRGVPDRRRAAGRELPELRSGSSTRPGGRAPRRCIPATASSPRTPSSRARALEHGLVWIGPPPEAIDAMGSKIEARERMRAAGVPIIPGVTEPVESADEVRRLGDELGWPVAIKASAGGGGKGLEGRARPRPRPSARSNPRGAKGEAYFSDAAVYVERYLEDPRHVEVQVLADTARQRHPSRRARLHDPAPPSEARRGDAVPGGRRRRCASGSARSRSRPARAVGYVSAGTIEGLLSRDGEYFFLEMNTRIQVEHTVTELVTGLDLVREQVLIAAGEPLSVAQEDVRLHGHAIECRINAEDVANGFLPAPGTITRYQRAERSRGARGLRRRRRQRDLAAVRPDDREARRARRRSRARAPADAARARRVRDRAASRR